LIKEDEMNNGFPHIEFSKTSEIPGALERLEADDLTKLVEARVQGERAGLPAPQRDEEPEDIILYAYRAGSEELRRRLREAISVLVMKHVTRAVAASKGQGSDAEAEGLLRRLFWLAGLTGAREALPAIVGFWRLPEKKLLSPALQLNILKCVGSLANESDVPLVPWLQEELSNPLNCRVAVQALFKIDPREAAKALPAAVGTLLADAGAGKAAGLLSRTLTLTVPSLPEGEQVQLLRLVAAALERSTSAKVFRAVTEAFELTPGLASEAQALLLSLKVRSLFEGTYLSYPGRALSSSLDYISQAATNVSYPTGQAFAYELGTDERLSGQETLAKFRADVISKDATLVYLSGDLYDTLGLFEKNIGYAINQAERQARERYYTIHGLFKVYGHRGLPQSANPFIEKRVQVTRAFAYSGERYHAGQVAIYPVVDSASAAV
jgi:hypothetical protein